MEKVKERMVLKNLSSVMEKNLLYVCGKELLIDSFEGYSPIFTWEEISKLTVEEYEILKDFCGLAIMTK